MEAQAILPVMAGHQTAKSQGPSGLSDVFAALLQEATIRLDARPADLASFENRRNNGEVAHRSSAAETISSTDHNDRRDDAGFRADSVDRGLDARRDRTEPSAPARDDTKIADDGELAAPAPKDAGAPVATVADDETAEPAAPITQLAEGDDAEAPAPTAQNETDPVPDEIATPVALPVQAQPVAAAAALSVARALGAGEAALTALNRAAAQSHIPTQTAPQAQAASAIAPAAAGQFGIEGGAARVQITPAAVVAHANATLGGGAAVAALAAEAAQNGAQNAGQNARASLPDTASQIAVTTIAGIAQNQAKPGNRLGLNGATADAQASTGNAASPTQSTTLGRNANGMANAAQIALAAIEAAPAARLQGQGQGQGTPVPGATNSAAGEPGSPNPQNAQAPTANSNSQNATGSGTPGGLSLQAPVSEAGAQNRLAQNARTDTAQSLGAPVPGTDAAPSTSQGARTAALESNHNNATQATRADGSAQNGSTAQAAAQNTPSGTASAGERATATVQRTEGAGPANANNPLTAGSLGLAQAAARTPSALPAQARPATSGSLPANQVAVHIQRAVSAGQDRIRISLHPAELGRIDVKLSLGNDGTVRAVVSVERPETFELLQRDARGLEKALQDAGLKTDSGSLSFNLKGESEQDTDAQREAAEADSQDSETETQTEPELDPEIIASVNSGSAGHALDMHV